MLFRSGPQQRLHRPLGAAAELLPRRRAELRHGLDPDPRRRFVRQRRWRSLRRCRARLRRDLREPDLRRRRHQLLDPPDHPLRRRRPRGRHQRPQRHIELAALLQGAGPVQLRQSRHDAARRRRRFRHHAAIARLGQRQPSVVPPHRDPRSLADAGDDPARHRLRRLGGGDLAAARHPERRLPPLRRRAPVGHRLSRPVRESGSRPGLLFRPVQRHRELLRGG